MARFFLSIMFCMTANCSISGFLPPNCSSNQQSAPSKAFESPEGKFQVSFPTDPKYRTENFNLGNGVKGDMLQRKYFHQEGSGKDSVLFLVEYVEIDPQILEKLGREKLIQIGLMSLEQNRGAPVKVRQSKVKMGNIDATEVEYKMTKSDSEIILVARLCLVDKRFYNVKSLGSAKRRNDLIRFIESFKPLQ